MMLGLISLLLLLFPNFLKIEFIVGNGFFFVFYVQIPFWFKTSEVS